MEIWIIYFGLNEWIQKTLELAGVFTNALSTHRNQILENCFSKLGRNRESRAKSAEASGPLGADQSNETCIPSLWQTPEKHWRGSSHRQSQRTTKDPQLPAFLYSPPILGHLKHFLHQFWVPGSTLRVPYQQSCTPPLEKIKQEVIDTLEIHSGWNLESCSASLPRGISADMLRVTVLDSGVALVKKFR